MHSVHKTRPIATDRVAWSAGLSVTFVSPEKQMTDRDAVWGLTHVGPRNHGSRSPTGRGNFGGLSDPSYTAAKNQ